MKKFWSWIVALAISPIIFAICMGTIYGMAWLVVNLGRPDNGHLPEIVGVVFIVGLLTIFLKMCGISDDIVKWISQKRRGR